MRHGFTRNFGRNSQWWITGTLAIAAVNVLEFSVTSLRRVYWPRDADLWQEIEKLGHTEVVLKEHTAERGEGGDFDDLGGDSGKPFGLGIKGAAGDHASMSDVACSSVRYQEVDPKYGKTLSAKEKGKQKMKSALSFKSKPWRSSTKGAEGDIAIELQDNPRR